MRYAVHSRSLDLGTVERECIRVNAKGIRVARISKQVFCDIDQAAVDRLRTIPGIRVTVVGGVKASNFLPGIWTPPRDPAQDITTLQPVYASSQASMFTLLFDLRAAFDPPLTGLGTTVAVLDTGIRKTHRGMRTKVILEEDYSGVGSPADVFNHGTGVAYIIGGGMHAAGQESGIAPGVQFMNIKVLDDEGVGTDETVVLGLERVFELWQAAVAEGLLYDDPMYPNFVNMSLGTVDDGNPDHPMRVAAEEIYAEAGIMLSLYAAAGNDGPEPGTVLLPAACPEVWAVGALTFEPFLIWEQSSRGPVDGLIKPDMVFPGVNVLTASAIGDDDFIVKTGSSFSCPMATGMISLIKEMALRFGLDIQYLPMEKEDMEGLFMFLSRKPEGTATGKDNDYGIGMPMGDLAKTSLELITGGFPVTELIMPIMSLAMMGMVLGSLGGMFSEKK